MHQTMVVLRLVIMQQRQDVQGLHKRLQQHDYNRDAAVPAGRVRF
jgi:hypothetical protein